MGTNQESLQLLQKIQNGSRLAFDTFYKMHYPLVFNISLNILKDHSEAEDVSHDVFLEVFQKIEHYDATKGSVRSWLAVMTKSRSLDRLRKKRPLLINRLEYLLKDEEKGADLQFLSELQRHLIVDALKQIPTEQREAIIRSYFRGETHSEIATTMDKPLGSIKSLIRYGLNNLRKQKSLLNWVESEGGKKKNG
ncbi:sigma-70 family RNA polymerase sigma factor [Halalkalibacterium halodurans]|jgi:RNA polymerase sigma-70 factor (ECF subfamily)|uniref:RNA polymerase ECF-type sigma factor n=2 Tax=Halalkalibacterium halodurans TaxID=86665 RepID=Q9K7Z1_HALH5|nr:sigma-70 family RNA polymerase sigma factor [Halalkalibacterium halodurans]MED3647182.1 sigma-70 family RNA polymerase sigma factor [Halalkalibacterium halodurans]MED4081154.1 sigma-70 family RNA polymerase sigma factor [Halalkalibacterium halodurans]MED4084397.1 sigma-70 family RNA polymerase sigma factor [Halalkalibacterium halodurans]MED4103534.1 sigma-70 family RNA polymerase sigma factor [Halalkalibacterium halodurans]MED4108799.1 sigma-70 family RNA polymerase sigma factor [Halalkalib